MSWHEYYRQPVTTFGEQKLAYKDALNTLVEMDVNILDRNTRKNIVLGGFHGAKTVSEFKQFCKDLFPNNHEYYLLDKNKGPLSSLDPAANPHRIQALLEELPFAPKSIDLMFLDYTLAFMDNIQIKKFFNKAHEALSTSGLVLATYNDPSNAGLRKLIQKEILNRLDAGVPISYLKQAKLCQLAEPLKPVFNSEFNSRNSYSAISSLAVFAQPNSRIPSSRVIF